jgi:hypothetical protein
MISCVGTCLPLKVFNPLARLESTGKGAPVIISSKMNYFTRSLLFILSLEEDPGDYK